MAPIIPMISPLLAVVALISKVYAGPYHLPSVQITFPEIGGSHPRVINPSSGEPGYRGEFLSGDTGLSYGSCYQIKHGDDILGTSGTNDNYLKFGDQGEKTFQVWYSRNIPFGKGLPQAVPNGGSFFLFDLHGSYYSNGGSWIAADLGGWTYPGYSPYNKYLRFKAESNNDWFLDSIGDHGIPIKLGLERVEPIGGQSGYTGLIVENDYIKNQNNDHTINVRFHKVSCYTGLD